MTDRERAILKEAQEYCDQEGKSTEFMIAYMMDVAEVEHETVMEFLTEQSGL